MKLILAILIFAGSLFGQQPSASEIVQKVRNRYQQINDASASFTQTVKLRYKRTGQNVTGTVKIKKGNKYRIESEQQTVVSDGVTVWMYTPKTKQVLIDRFKFNRQPFSPDKFLLGLPGDVTTESVTKQDSVYILRLTPSAKNSSLANITALTVWTSGNRWDVEKIEMIEKSGTTITIVLTDLQLNGGIDESVFQFLVTKEMHVVDINSLQ
ncbi:MAG: outer membrane lipoprotein carrier protein LolA [Bacteriovoracaceae bacterium]|nr:outer membrane lipoprotein carrier protein LolA [Bacteroidota bacterium]